MDVPIILGTAAPGTTTDPLPGAIKEVGDQIAGAAQKGDDERAKLYSEVSGGLAYDPDHQGMADKMNQHSLPPQPPPVGQKKEITIQSEGGFNKGGNYRPASFKITESSEPEPPPAPSDTQGGSSGTFNYPRGVGPVMQSRCFGTGYKPPDPCAKSKVPASTCKDGIDAAAFIGVGFDGRGGYNAQSRKQSLIQR